MLCLGSVIHLICEIKHQVHDAARDFDIDPSTLHLFVPVDFAVIVLLAVDLLLALKFFRFGFQLGLLLHDFVFFITNALDLHSSLFSLISLHLLAFTKALVTISIILLILLLLHKLLDQHVFLLLLIKSLLRRCLVDSQLATSALPFFSSEVALLLRLLDLVHGGREAKVLNLARRNTLLLLLTTHSILHVHILLDA